jgi:hypothetical protein
VGRAVLESASAAFQAAATPSQLPTQQKQQKKPDVLMTPGFRYSSEMSGPVSHAQWIIAEHIRRMTGELFFRYPSLCGT